MRTILYLHDSQGFSLSILDGYFYWSDWQQKKIGMFVTILTIKHFVCYHSNYDTLYYHSNYNALFLSP